MNESLIQALQLSIKLSIITSILLLIIVPPIAFGISKLPSKWHILFEFFFSLPLIFPPIILGFFLLLIFSPEGFLGQWFSMVFSETLAFSFWGVLAASFIYTFPHMYRQTRAAFTNLDPRLTDLARMLGKSEKRIFFTVIIPQSLPLILKSMVFCFSHIIGAFGVIVMVGGSIPDKTKVASIALFELVETFQYHEAFDYALVLMGISLCSAVIMEVINRLFIEKKRKTPLYADY
ncbi:MAG: ABC transporter permease subunit [Spirochaetales bacterium]|nr:ABC transporter permease subunit [Spirochaetales bacterium]